MYDDEDYSSSDDEDYVPDDGEIVSEEENSGDEEDLSVLKEDQDETEAKGGRGKRKKSKKKSSDLAARKRKGGIKLDDDTNETEETEDDKHKKELSEQIEKEKMEKKEEQEKKRTENLWASFLSDVGGRPKPKPAPSSGLGALGNLSKPCTSSSPKSVTPTSTPVNATGKVKVTKVYDFAGEAVEVTKEVDVNSKEAKAALKEKETADKPEESPSPVATTATSAFSGKGPGIKRPGGGLGGVLNSINKKPKMGTLEKSKLDWNSFKEQEGISEELKIHNRGKSGYLERMAFLERTDHRQFEIEKGLRQSNSKR
ncbi:craniofacial development protein 1-like [Ylistrum balloti]|uniref:craniofacial development protein 1-like n=1 Tax=Ylistrum balloti TaxID=509963 RepID=UPI002905F341|nr:craniofacial development protein 1-like [Ylistrum balloti]